MRLDRVYERRPSQSTGAKMDFLKVGVGSTGQPFRKR